MIGKANALVELGAYPAWRAKSGTWSKKDSPARQTRDTCVSAIFWPCLTLLDTRLRPAPRPAPAGSGTGPAGWHRGACAARPQPPARAIAALSPAGEWLHGPMRLAAPASLSRHPRLADGVGLSTCPRVGRSEIVPLQRILGLPTVIWARSATAGMDTWEMRWETRHASAVKDYERKREEGKVQLVDLTQKLDDAARS